MSQAAPGWRVSVPRAYASWDARGVCAMHASPLPCCDVVVGTDHVVANRRDAAWHGIRIFQPRGPTTLSRSAGRPSPVNGEWTAPSEGAGGQAARKSLGVLMVDREACHGVHCAQTSTGWTGRGRSVARWPGRSWAGGDVAIRRRRSTAHVLCGGPHHRRDRRRQIAARVAGSWCVRGSNRAAWVVELA
jgi:hypothetical protein